MDFVGVVVLTQILGGAAEAPSVRLTPLETGPVGQCEAQAEQYSKIVLKSKFTTDGKLIVSSTYQCMVITDSNLQKVVNFVFRD